MECLRTRVLADSEAFLEAIPSTIVVVSFSCHLENQVLDFGHNFYNSCVVPF